MQLKEDKMKMPKLRMHKPRPNQVVKTNNKIMMVKMTRIWITMTELMELVELVEQVQEMVVPEDHPLHEMFD
jgi:hypothetical protein